MEIEIPRSNQAQFDYVEGLKALVVRKLMPKMRAAYDAKEAAQPIKPQTKEEAGKLVAPSLLFKYNRTIQGISQEMMWAVVYEALEPQRTALSDKLAQVTGSSLGNLELDPECVMPEYYRTVDFHLMPRNYQGDPLAGAVYDLGVPIYGLHRNGPLCDAPGHALVSVLPKRAYGKILDMGCGVGQKLLPVVDAFPDAEVWGIDLAAPMLQCAHQRAERLGRRVIFNQRNAEQTNFPADHFGLVTSLALMHELPESAIRNMIAESYRILEPGGLCAHLDLPPYRAMTPYATFIMDWDTKYNGEPYLGPSHELNIAEMFQAAGFKNVREVQAQSQWNQGGFYTGSYNYWVTMGEK